MQTKKRDDMQNTAEVVKDNTIGFPSLVPSKTYDESFSKEISLTPELSWIDRWLLLLGIKTMAPNSPKGIQWTAPNITLMLFIVGGVFGVGMWYGTTTEQNHQRDVQLQQLQDRTHAIQEVIMPALNSNAPEPIPTPKGVKK